jgi:RHS repeat-associated protein
MSNARSLPAHRNHQKLLGRLALLLLAVGVPASHVFAQTCGDTGNVTYTVVTADGSNPGPANDSVRIYPYIGNAYSYPFAIDLPHGSFPGTTTKPFSGASGETYRFRAAASDYFDEFGGSAHCTPILGCATPYCTGDMSVAVYSAYGSLTGRITYSPDGAPAEGVWVNLDPGDRTSPGADASGEYKFVDAAHPENNWGLPVDRAQGPPGFSGPGTSVWQAYVLSEDQQTVTITSNHVTKANFEIPRSDAEADPRGSQPPPSPVPDPCSDVGGPVSVITGNVAVDQTDASVPGRGLGLLFSRSYNSHNSALVERYGVFGPGWNHSYEKRLTFPWNGSIKLRNSDGTITYFSGSDTAGYEQTAPFSKASRIVKQASSNLYVRQFLQGGQEVYDRLAPAGTTARLASLADAVGNTTVLTYDTGNKLTTIADPGGRQLTLGYVGAELRTLSGPAGPIAAFTYDASGRLSTVTYADGDTDSQPDGGYTFAYHGTGDGEGKLWTVTDLSGRVTETQIYDALGRAIETSISGNVRKYTLDYQADKTVVTDSLGNETEYHFQKIWGAKRITQISGCTTCGGGSATQFWGYDEKGRITSHTDGEGNLTEYTYDNDGNLVTIDSPVLDTGERHTTEMAYNNQGRLVTRIAPNGSTTTWTYVAAGPETMTEEVSPGVTRTTTYAYGTVARSLGKLKYVRDPLNRQTDFAYTLDGDLESVTDASGHTTTFQYDVMGRTTKTIPPATTPASDTPTTSYDTLGRAWKVTNPNATYWRNTYDGGGRRTVARDPSNNNTTYVYDTYGRLSTVTNSPNGLTNYVTEYRYDTMSNLRYLIDPRQYPQPSPVPTTATEFRYEDGHNRVTDVIYPGNLTEEFTYDLAGRLATRTDRKGVETAFTYDALGRLTGKTYSDSSAPVTFTYDGGDDTGFLTGASNSADTLGWDYDRAGQVLSESSTRNGTTVSYQYFLSGQREKVRLNGSDVLTYAYEADSQLNTLTRATGVVFDFNADVAHRRQNVMFPNGTTTEYSYDLLSRLSLVHLKRGATVLNDVAYESNDLNNRTARTENGVRLQYGYDNLSRLLAVNRTLPTAALLEQYTYDQVGNRQTALGVPGTWSYNDRSELTSYNGISFTYDLNGNQLTRSGTPSRTNTWDVENRLTAVVDGGVTKAQFEYDPLGRRVAKTVPGVGLTRFAYDGEDILFEQGPSGNFTYLHGPGIDEPLARETSTGVRTYYHADGLGSIVKRTDAAGTVIGTQSYDSFGVGTGLPSGFGYTGREWDSESALAHYRARIYDPQQGRFLSKDPIGFRGGLNVYSYVNNRPTSLIDPWGLAAGSVNQITCDVDPWKGSPGGAPRGGCGSEWSDFMVPDLFPESCYAHDKCYDTCGSDKDRCDENFFGSIVDECLRMGHGAVACLALADTYRAGVQAFGGGPFSNSQSAACPKPPPCEPSDYWCNVQQACSNGAPCFPNLNIP